MRLPPSDDEIRTRLGPAWPVFGAVDSHAHVFERGFPFAAERGNPAPYPLEYYLEWMHALRIPRCVQVTASCYGFDNSVTRYAIEECRMSGVAVRGVAIIHPDIEDAELASLASSGFVAARLIASRVANFGTGDFDALARRCAEWRWHLEVNVDQCDDWLELERRLAGSPVPLVFEHLGVGPGDGPDSAGVRAVLRLLERRADFAVKLRFPDLAPVLGVFVRDYPDRLMWGSSLPQDDAGPDDLDLIAHALEHLPDPALRERVFATNAERFYGF